MRGSCSDRHEEGVRSALERHGPRTSRPIGKCNVRVFKPRSSSRAFSSIPFAPHVCRIPRVVRGRAHACMHACMHALYLIGLLPLGIATPLRTKVRHPRGRVRPWTLLPRLVHLPVSTRYHGCFADWSPLLVAAPTFLSSPAQAAFTLSMRVGTMVGSARVDTSPSWSASLQAILRRICGQIAEEGGRIDMSRPRHVLEGGNAVRGA